MSYGDKLFKAIHKTSGVRVAFVYHDKDCPKLSRSGDGDCSCNAEVELSEPITDANISQIVDRMYPSKG
jgi:hypothetical protein